MTETDDDTIAPVSTSRLEAFSDGVMAIAATLLILEVHRPGTGESIGRWLVHTWPQLTAYAISFGTIGILWLNHHGMFHIVRQVDRTLLLLNLMLLMTVAFLPLPTVLAGTRADDPGSVIFFTATLGAGASWLALMWAHLHRHPYLLTPAARGRTAKAIRRTLVGPVCYVVAGLLALLSPQAALVIDAATALYFVLPPRHLRVRHPAR